MNTTLENTLSEIQKHTILVVDDNPTNLGIISNYLKDYNFRILVAKTGELGLKRAEYIHPDIILLDVMMPGIDGFETCRRLKANPTTKDIPVIFMTALAQIQHKVTGFKVGAVDYVTKPLQHEEVLARIRTHLQIRDLTKTLEKRNLQLQTSNQVGQHISSILDLSELLTEVVGLLRIMFDYHFVGIWLLTKEKDRIILKTGTGSAGNLEDNDNEQSIALNETNNIIASVCQTKQSSLIKNVSSQEETDPSTLPETQVRLTLPLRIGQNILGVLDIQSNKPEVFDTEDESILQTLANQIAVAIRNARLYKKGLPPNQPLTKDLTVLDKHTPTNNQINQVMQTVMPLAQNLDPAFKNLLTEIKTISDTDENISTEVIQNRIQQLYYNTQHTYHLWLNLITWLKLQTNSLTYQPASLNLNKLVDSYYTVWENIASQKNVVLLNVVEKNVTIYVDQDFIDTTIHNLISNALKFTSQGEIRISATEGDNNLIEITIADTGTGITSTSIDNLFQLDQHQLPQGAKPKLGLAICKNLIEQAGGQISVNSQVNQGTTVILTLPAYH